MRICNKNIWWWHQVYNELQEYGEKFKFRKRSSHLLMNITLIDNFWGSHLGILHLNTQNNNRGHHVRLFNSSNIVLLYLGIWLEKIMVLWLCSTFWVHFTMLAPNSKHALHPRELPAGGNRLQHSHPGWWKPRRWLSHSHPTSWRRRPSKKVHELALEEIAPTKVETKSFFILLTSHARM